MGQWGKTENFLIMYSVYSNLSLRPVELKSSLEIFVDMQ